jgi:hypothetical protein
MGVLIYVDGLSHAEIAEVGYAIARQQVKQYRLGRNAWAVEQTSRTLAQWRDIVQKASPPPRHDTILLVLGIEDWTLGAPEPLLACIKRTWKP